MVRSWPPLLAWPFKLLAWSLGIYVGLCFLAFLAQRRMMYFPDREGEPEALQRAVRVGLAPWQAGMGQ